MKPKAIKNTITGLFLGPGGTLETGPEWVDNIANAWKTTLLNTLSLALFLLSKQGYTVKGIFCDTEN